jgi:RNA ligase
MESNMFPNITQITDLLPYIDGNSQFRVQKQSNGHTVVCYMLQDEDTFTGENEEYAKECRGITFDENGYISSRTMHKFQNVGENEFTQFDVIPWDDIYRVTDKRDGSMITFVSVNGEVVGKTKKTFTSAEAIAATKLLKANPTQLAWVEYLLANHITPTFEFTSPRFPIVLQYEKDELTLLQVRKNVTGEYAVFTDENDFYFESEKGNQVQRVYVSPFPVVKSLFSQFVVDGKFDAQGLIELAKTETGIEGWIVQARNGAMWKVKTKWYCDLHHAVTFVRWRDIAKAVIDETSDDLKAAFSLVGKDIQPIVKVENTIAKEIADYKQLLATFVGEATAKYGVSNPKGIATDSYFKQNSMFGHLMRVIRGQEIDFTEWYKKNKIDTWGLEVAVNMSNEDGE